nr:MAG TPA: hypothetical protein [Caudoviricetes sp.]
MKSLSPANVAGIAASFCSGVVFRTAIKSVLVGAAPINLVVSFIGITALSLTVEDRVSRTVSKFVQQTVDEYKEASKKGSEQEEA